jgi:hypothetical protein
MNAYIVESNHSTVIRVLISPKGNLNKYQHVHGGDLSFCCDV